MNENEFPLVTVAIAAYNVEKFLRHGLRYIQNQTYLNLEIILVDDGSTDLTPEICDAVAKEDSRIRVFHKENGGLGSARNVGIDQAKGEYLYFFDVDDSVEPDFIADSVQYAEQKNVDLIIYGYYARFSSSPEDELINVSEREISCNDDLKKAYCDELIWLKHGNGFVWNKFYRMSFLRKFDFHFGNQRIQQDEPFNMQLYPKLEHVYICPKAYYHYVLYGNGSAGSRYFPNKAEIITDIFHKFMDLYTGWELTDKNVLRFIQNQYVSDIFGVATRNFFHKDCKLSKKERWAIIEDIIHDDDLTNVLQHTKIGYGSNPVNNLQAWAFNHGKTGMLIIATRVKNYLKKYI